MVMIHVSLEREFPGRGLGSDPRLERWGMKRVLPLSCSGRSETVVVLSGIGVLLAPVLVSLSVALQLLSSPGFLIVCLTCNKQIAPESVFRNLCLMSKSWRLFKTNEGAKNSPNFDLPIILKRKKIAYF